ncbi:hypothetical protein L1987_80943 [Smallanthus sonchifolius]|uniref:Uncharacterized protein n=1 Tax=Smallanthus sonchifolius TaxID=185202 RepID=A0ACB8YQN5_9ASTR|nr:hypothetical protein L1987_80943 [Smallanthus sonchifolius]
MMSNWIYDWLLLDLKENMERKLSPTRIGPANLQATFVMTQVAGTLEYVDPQYHKTGFCEEASERIAVFEHMVNGSLKEHVKNTSLTWKQRLKICIDVARGLAYIHSGSHSLYSVHGGIKSSSILINTDWKAVISDFIISKGRLAVETIKSDQQQPLRGDHEAGRVIFLSQLAAQCFKNKRLEEDEWEWEQKLPEDYKKITSMSKLPLASTSRSKDLYSLLSSGILLQNEKLWFSIGMNGVKNEMVSARLFSFKNVKWRSIRKPRPRLEEYKGNNELNDEKNVQRLVKHDLYIDSLEIIKRSEMNIQNAPKEELCLLLFNGILIDKGEKV